jgi:hypothetical protein
MVKNTQFQRLSYPDHRCLAPPVNMVLKNLILQRSNDIEIFTKQKNQRGSLHHYLKVRAFLILSLP